MEQKPKRGRRLLRFGLKSALVLMLVASLALAWIAGKMQEAKLEARCVESLEQLAELNDFDLKVRYDYQCGPFKVVTKKTHPRGPAWIRSVFGEHIFSRVETLQLLGGKSPIARRPSRQNLMGDLQSAELKNLKMIKNIQLTGFSELSALKLLAGNANLERLTIDESHRLESLSGIEDLKNLKTVRATGFMSSLGNVRALSELGELEIVKLSVNELFATTANWDALSGKPKLVELTVRRRPSTTYGWFEVVSSAGTFRPGPCLEILDFENVDPGLEDLKCCKSMPQLRSLRIVGSESLKSLNGIEHCSSLEFLSIKDCPNLEDLQGLEKLRCLANLEISASGKKLVFPTLQCKHLKTLYLKELQGLTDLCFLCNLKKLTLLNVGNSDLKSLKGLGHLTSLRDLHVCGSGLETIGCEQPIKASVTRLDLSYCKNLADLEGAQNFKLLIHVLLNECENLRSLDGIGRQRKLYSLDLSGCPQVDSLDALVDVPSLGNVSVNRCINLSNVSSLLNVERLETFEWSGCLKLNQRDVIQLLDKFSQLDEWPDATVDWKQDL